MSNDFSSFQVKDPIRALYLVYQTGEAVSGRERDGEAAALAARPVEDLSREELVKVLDQEMRAQSAWTLFFHASVAERLKLNATDHKCLDMIWRKYEADAGDYMTPGQLAREVKLTTGAVTGVLDRLEQAGYVRREHDPRDRRRIIVRPVPERIHADVWPLFSWVSEEFVRLCGDYSDAELRRAIEFSRRAQAMLQRATDQLRAVDAD